LDFHLAMRAQKLGSAGAARHQFGNVAAVYDDCRDQWRFAWIENFWQDLRYGAHQLRRSPGFTAAAAIPLALGVGAPPPVFSICATVLWRPVRLPEPDRLALILQAHPDNSHVWLPASPADIEDIRRAITSLQDVTSWANASSNLVD